MYTYGTTDLQIVNTECRCFLSESTLLFSRIKPKKAGNSLPIQRKAVLLQADYYQKMIRD